MADYIIKDIPEEKMKEFKTACAFYKVTMKEAFIDIMDGIIEKYQRHICKATGERTKPKKKG